MAYNTKPIIKDVDGNPISQYYNPDTDSYEPVEGVNGANKVTVENNDLSLIPILDKLSQLTGTVIDEETRKSNELERIDNEGTRKSNEDIRNTNEITRVENEEIRIQNENTRIQNEDIRQTNEQNRVNLYNDLIDKVNSGYFDGKNLEFHWRGTELGVRVEGETEYIYVDLKGETGDIENLTMQHIINALGYTPIKSVNNMVADEAGNVELDIDTSEIENRIGNVENDLVAHKADYIHLPYSIADGTDTYTTLINGISSLVEGMSIKIKFTNANTGASTLNINGLGAIPIKKSNGNDLSAGNIKAGQICHLVYTGSVFQLLGEGGEYGEYGNVTPGDVIKGVTFGTEEGLKTGTLELTGNAVATDVLSGKTFYSTNPKSKLTGSMTNRGAVSRTLTTQGGSYTIPAGYHNGSGKVTAQFANLIPSNIRNGVTIGGVTGSYIVETITDFKVATILDNVAGVNNDPKDVALPANTRGVVAIISRPGEKNIWIFIKDGSSWITIVDGGDSPLLYARVVNDNTFRYKLYSSTQSITAYAFYEV